MWQFTFTVTETFFSQNKNIPFSHFKGNRNLYCPKYMPGCESRTILTYLV